MQAGNARAPGAERRAAAGVRGPAAEHGAQRKPAGGAAQPLGKGAGLCARAPRRLGRSSRRARGRCGRRFSKRAFGAGRGAGLYIMRNTAALPRGEKPGAGPSLSITAGRAHRPAARASRAAGLLRACGRAHTAGGGGAGRALSGTEKGGMKL